MAPLATPKILLVDDNRDFLEVTEKILDEMTDYQVVSLDQGGETLETALREKPDVIVLDVYMPGADGAQICRELKTTQDLQNIPVLFLTAVGQDPRFRARCLEEGGDDFLMKPADSQELVARLRVLLRIKNLQDTLREERDELEEKVQERAKELEQKETLAAIGKMVAGVAHEIRNPLGAISNSAAVLSRDLVLEGEDQKLMEIIVQESNRLRDTITDFLTFAHPPPYHFREIDVKRLIEDVYLLAKRDNLCGPDVDIEVDIPEKLPPLKVDCDRLQQVLWNLIRNALEAIRGQGKVRVSAKQQTEHGREGVLIEVSDSGPGISVENMENIFTPFFTSKTRGSGLGLAMVQSAVRAHGGKIRVMDGDGGGAGFQVWLPIADW
jgi:signal transduction histidine kinase